MVSNSVADAPLEDIGAGPLDLYFRWEQYNWRIADLDFAADRPAWDALPAVIRSELISGLGNFFLGEVAVTETLAPLAHAAVRQDYRLFLCTQLADEARHALFFQHCLDALAAEAAYRPADLHVASRRTEAFADVFERLLSDYTAAVRPGGDPAAWYRAVTLYHLLAEAVLAMTVLHSMADTVRALPGLAALSAGLSLVTKDEARHAAFGVIAIREGVQHGHRDAIGSAIRDSVPALARALVDPERLAVVPALPPLQAMRGRWLIAQWDSAARMLRNRLVRVGLAELTEDTHAAWRAGCDAAVDEYEDIHGRRHPSRLANRSVTKGKDINAVS